MEAFLAETHHIRTESGDLNTPFVGTRLDMQKAERLSMVIAVTGGAAAVITLALQQHTLASAGVSKALNYVGAYFYKLAGDSAYTKVEISELTPAATIDLSSVFASASGTIILEVLQENLDVDNNFRYVSLVPTDAAVASPVSITYLGKAKYAPGYASLM